MIRFDVPYGGGRLAFSLPEACVRQARGRPDTPRRPSEEDRLRLAHGIGEARTLLVVVNDAYRPTPTQELLEPFAPELSRCGEVRIVIATGMHPAPAREEIDRLLGDWGRRHSVHVHDGRSAIAFSFSSATTVTGPDDMNVTRSSRNGRPSCTA